MRRKLSERLILELALLIHRSRGDRLFVNSFLSQDITSNLVFVRYEGCQHPNVNDRALSKRLTTKPWNEKESYFTFDEPAYVSICNCTNASLPE